ITSYRGLPFYSKDLIKRRPRKRGALHNQGVGEGGRTRTKRLERTVSNSVGANLEARSFVRSFDIQLLLRNNHLVTGHLGPLIRCT
ncbi:MAG: hypothetical protein WAM44_14460, partial [Chthoniobacterales bacterium]